MQHPEAYLPTEAHTPGAHTPGGLPGPMHHGAPLPAHAPQPDPRRRVVVVIAVLVATLLFGLGIGVAIGRATAESIEVAPVAAPELGRLGVSSVPVDGNVTVDGRFVGVAPIERLDLDPGRHSIVIDAFGYKPYAGALEILPRGKVNLTVLLASIGAGTSTNGNVTGQGKATTVVIPPSALLPAGAGSGGADAKAKLEPKRSPRQYDSSSYSPPPPPPAYEPPPRPRRDCGGEKSRCRDSCSRAEGDCRFNCPYCVTCSSTVGSEECKRQCETCRSSCDRNTKFCETTCDGQYDNCQASQ